MFGLNKCNEEKFGFFKYKNKAYVMNVGSIAGGALFVSSILLFVEWIFANTFIIKEKDIILALAIFTLAGSGITSQLKKVINERNMVKIQKQIVIIDFISIVICSLTLYIFPYIMSYDIKAEKYVLLLIIILIIISAIFTVCHFINVVNLIKEGNAEGENFSGIYGKIGTIISKIGFSIPVIIAMTTLAKRITLLSRTNVVPIILMLAFAFIIQSIMSIFIPECLIILYCKFRFKSFQIKHEEENADNFVNRNKNKKSH